MAKSAANPTPKSPHWPPKNEVNLLNAILEIANEPVESYDPRINLFDRINKNMEKSLTDREILDKIKQLRKRFRKSCRKIESGNCYVKRTRMFKISEKIWGKERELNAMDAKRALICFYELDTASLPNNFEETFPCVNVDTPAVSAQKLNFNKEDSYHRTPTSKGNFTSTSNDDYLQAEFHDFQEDRSIEKLKCGQIWALYCDIDQYPKFYAMIKKVDVEDIVVSASWVELHATGDDEASWVEKELPATCGRFKVDRWTMTVDSIDSFSHIVHANPIGHIASKYDIYPRNGEVWAIYKDWNADWTLADLGKCKCYVAEILEVGNSVVKVVLLTKVADYTTVFKREANRDVDKMMEIPLNENLRFSHQIPAFRLTNELDGALKGCWELDPASVPGQMYN